MAFFMDVSDMIDDFGVDIKVWKPDDQVSQAYPGGQTTDIDLSEEKAEPRHEPVMPVNPNSALARSIIAGGGQLRGKLVWYSTSHYETGTIVYVPSQFGYYKVTNYGGWETYSHFYEYLLQGDDANGINE